ncbi:MAG: tRNA (N6-isopentenyl adenosine(37)-C2)-methylthiotransferase MiaB [Alphaproteobacteria bacterium]|nr:tRNA (N6-isopentenyl adenosine(37)-C2)-methylthiotransferase MiaB [Alphaproteobacteria bacterium]
MNAPLSASKKKLYIKTYGCQMNVYDSTRMADVLAPIGYEPTSEPNGADMVILNTCHIREKAEEKVYSDLGRIRPHKEKKASEGSKMLIAVGGCVGQAEGAEIIKRAPYVDIVLGSQSYHRLPDMVASALRDGGGVVDLEFPEEPKFDTLPEATAPTGKSAFLAVQEGCDKFCTFCVVPYTRGAEYSRSVDEIISEAKILVRGGAVELTLLGQNVNAYHGLGADAKDWSLAQLIKALAKIDGLERIRYTTSHPRDMRDDLIAVHGDEPKLMPYLHLPIQSGSNHMLKQMNRKHTAEDYLEIIDKLRAARPDIALSSDFIVGFPGESDEDFKATMALVESVGYAQAYSFKYSQRPGTPAADHAAQIDEDVKSKRLQLLQGLLNRQQAAFNRATVGKTFPVLFEREGKYAGHLIGKSPYLQSVHVRNAKNLMGQLVEVNITEALDNSLAGEVVLDNTNILKRA